MDILDIIEAIGGGLPAVVIAFLGYAGYRLWIRLNTVTDARIQDHKEHTIQLMEATRTLEAAISLVKDGG